MAIMIKSGGSGEKPDAGLMHAVCVNVVDLGVQSTNFGDKHQVAIVWELEQLYSEGDYKGERMVKANAYTASLNEKANLRKHLEQWRGKRFTDDELRGFDIEVLKGKPCILNLIENDKGYMDIASLSPDKEAKLQPVRLGYVPKWLAEKAGQELPKGEEPEPKAKFEDDIPF